jgi:hypothetical protein
MATAPAVAEDAGDAGRTDTIRLETTTVTGNRELPRVMVIVPWKQALPGDLPGRPAESLLDEVLAPIDRQVFRRQLAFYESLEGAPGAESMNAGDAEQRIVEESGG